MTVTVPDRDGIYARIPEDVYHSDKQSLSSSGARLLVATTPLEFRYQIDQPPPPRSVLDYGSACHKLVLGEGQHLHVVDADSWRTNAAKDQREWAWGQGKAVLLTAQMEEAKRMAKVVYEHPLAAALLAQGQAELSGWWTDPETGVRLRFRPDFVTATPRTVVVDYKTTTNANPRKFAKSAADFGYHCQGPWYLDGLAATTGIEDAAFVVIAQSKTPPYPVSVNQFDADDMERGRVHNRKAIRLYAACLDTGQWPGYEGLNVLSLPGWARRDMDEDMMEGQL